MTGDGDCPPKMLKAFFDPCFERRPALQRPKQERSHERLLELKRNLLFFQARVDLSALLPCGHDPGDHLASFGEVAVDKATNGLACEKGGDQGTGEVGTAPGFLGDAKEQTMQHRLNSLFAGFGQRHGFSYLAQLNFSHHTEHVIFALEIVEKGTLAHIRAVGDVFHRDIGETTLGKKLKRATEQAHTSFGGTTLAASHALQVRKVLGSESLDESGGVRCMTVSH